MNAVCDGWVCMVCMYILHRAISIYRYIVQALIDKSCTINKDNSFNQDTMHAPRVVYKTIPEMRTPH